MLGRRIVGPRKVVLAVDLGDGIVAADPAVNIEDSDLQKYKESLFDMEHVKLNDGEEPTYFTIKPLTRRQKDAAVTGDGSLRQRAIWFIRCGLQGVENYQIIEDDKESMLSSPETKSKGKLGELVTEGWIDKLDLPEEYLLALFVMIQEVSEATLPLSKQ